MASFDGCPEVFHALPEMTVGAVAKRFNVSRMTIYRYTTKGNHSEKINDE
ncbi:helix-turn-helix domain-containing protein [Escherichia coli]